MSSSQDFSNLVQRGKEDSRARLTPRSNPPGGPRTDRLNDYRKATSPGRSRLGYRACVMAERVVVTSRLRLLPSGSI
jgi:hypothetical protein